MKKNNKGYTLVETIIVISMIAVLSSIAVLSLSIVKGARTKKAATSLNSQLASLRLNTMGKSADLCIKLYYDATSKEYIVQQGSSSDGTLTNFVASGDPLSLGTQIKINYINDAGVTYAVDEIGMIIQFNKSDGSVISGGGKYVICRDNGSSDYTVVLNSVTGSREIE